MFQAPTSENKQSADPTRAQPSQEQGSETDLYRAAVPARTAKRSDILQRTASATRRCCG